MILSGALSSEQSTSLGMLAGFAKAFENGIIVESSKGLDAINGAATIVYDRFDGVEVSEEEMDLFAKLSKLNRDLIIFNDGPVDLEDDQYRIYNNLSVEEKLEIMDKASIAGPVAYIGDNSKDIALLQKSYVGISRGGIKDKKVISSVDVMVDNSNVTLTMQTNSLYDQDILGYEVVRVTTSQGQTQKEVVGFTTTNTFTDSVNLGSRAISYEVYAVGKDTHRSSVYNTHTHKIYSDGNQDKTQMTVSTNMISSLDQNHESNENMPCETVKIHAIDMVLDNQKEKEYVGKAESDPTITIDLKQNLDISALRYYAKTSPIKDYKIEVSVDNKNYSTVRMGTFDLKNNQETIYFAGDNGEGKWNQAYNARYIRITALNQKNKDISILEFDILGPSGDNVELMNDNETPAIGKLAHDYVYETSTGAKIPAGSIVFTGEYKGNPAYNVVVLYDENGKIVGGLDDEGSINAESIILAPDPGDGLLGETSEGTWIYWISPEYAKNLPSKVRAELYRVDNAQTNEGQRLVSDTIFVDVPKNLPSISFEK